MISIIIAALVISQLVCFAVIAILNTKISNFKQIEKNQESIMEDIENTISVYLLDMKEENDRLIEALKNTKPLKSTTEYSEAPVAKNEKNAVQLVALDTPKKADVVEQVIEGVKVVPKSMAANAYKKNTIKSPVQEPKEKAVVEEALATFEQQVVQYYKNGLTVEEIAKKTQKGKTEIELLIKFHA